MSLEGWRKGFHQLRNIRYRPRLLANIGKAYFNRLLLQKPTLRVCEFSITPSCQSRCQFCYASKFVKPGEEILTVEQIGSIWEQAKKLGAFSSVVFGGEPLLHPQFLDIIALLEPKKHIITFTTNAIALDEALVLELKRLGVFLVNLSLNSMDPTLNDTLRGYKGHFDKVMQGIELCKKHGLSVFLPIATAKPYWNETMKIVEFADKNGCGVTINLMCAMGRAEGRHEDMFDEEFWKELRKLYNSHSNIRSDYDVNLSLKVGCPSGHEKIHIAPYGDVTGCSMQAPSFGNALKEPLATIVERMRAFRHYAKRSGQCIIALDKEYISEYMDFAQKYPSLPYPIEDNPCYARDKGQAKVSGKAK